jgi:hypothetical protein
MRRCGFVFEGPIRIFDTDGVRYGLPLREPARTHFTTLPACTASGRRK